MYNKKPKLRKGFFRRLFERPQHSDYDLDNTRLTPAKPTISSRDRVSYKESSFKSKASLESARRKKRASIVITPKRYRSNKRDFDYPIAVVGFLFLTGLIMIFLFMLQDMAAIPGWLASSSASSSVATPVQSSTINVTPSISGTVVAVQEHSLPIPSTIEPLEVVTQENQTLADLTADLGIGLNEIRQISDTILLLPNQSLTFPTATASSTVQQTLPVSTEVAIKYMFPIQPAELAQYEEYHHDYPATDIFAPAKSVVVAVTSGFIEELSREDNWDANIDDPATRGGLFISLIGDDGVRYYYSHLESLEASIVPGDRVVSGQLIGYVGKSGNAITTPYHLHFGISRPTQAGDWIIRRGELVPYQYLQAWSKNDYITPAISK